MLDPKAVTKMVEDQIASTVNNQVLEVFATDDWLQPIEEKIIKYTQDRIVSKFANSSAVPEIVDAVKSSVAELFAQGAIPGVETFVDKTTIKQAVDQAVEGMVDVITSELSQDPSWLAKIETLINQAVTQRTLASLGSIDIDKIITDYVNQIFQQKSLNNFATAGMQDIATECQLTIMNGEVVVEQQLTARTIEAVEDVIVKNLTVKGSINTDNHSWQTLAENISEKTIKKINQDWRDTLVLQVKDQITNEGIDFSNVNIDGRPLIDGNILSGSITHSNLQSVGVLNGLRVRGCVDLNETLNVNRKRVGINTEEPESALTVWDEEVNLQVGKYKNQEAYIGTGRTQALNIGINKDPQITLNNDGITNIKKLRVAQWRIGHSAELPNWGGTRGDIIFNSNPTPNSAFAWVCLGAHKWKVLKATE